MKTVGKESKVDTQATTVESWDRPGKKVEALTAVDTQESPGKPIEVVMQVYTQAKTIDTEE